MNFFIRIYRGDKVLGAEECASLSKMLFAAAIMGIVVKYITMYIGSGVLGLSLCVICGAVVYFAVCLVLREKTLFGFVSSVLGKGKK